MENLQIEAGYVFKLVGICCGGVAYYLSLKNSFGILNERQKVNKRFIECHENDIKNLKSRMDILETKHEDKWCDEKRSKNRP